MLKIIHIGDIGRKFYVILSGEVSILTPEKGVNAKRPSRKHSRSDFLNNIEDLKKKELPEEDIIKNIYTKHNIIKTLKQGATFGEIALQQNTIRQESSFIILFYL